MPARALSRSTRRMVHSGSVNRTDLRSSDANARYGGNKYSLPAYPPIRQTPETHISHAHHSTGAGAAACGRAGVRTHIRILLALHAEAEHGVDLHLLELRLRRADALLAVARVVVPGAGRGRDAVHARGQREEELRELLLRRLLEVA